MSLVFNVHFFLLTFTYKKDKFIFKVFCFFEVLSQGLKMSVSSDLINFLELKHDIISADAHRLYKDGAFEEADILTGEAEKYEQIIGLLKSQTNHITSLKPSIYVFPDELKDLPPDLLKQLNISSSDKQDFQIIEAIDSVGGVASIDKILIAYYHLTKQVFERQKLMAKLYRMANKGLLYSHPSKKGIYGTSPIEDKMTKGDEDDED